MSTDALLILATKRAYCREMEAAKAPKPKVYQVEEMILHLDATFTHSVTHLVTNHIVRPRAENTPESSGETNGGNVTKIALNFLGEGIELPELRS